MTKGEHISIGDSQRTTISLLKSRHVQYIVLFFLSIIVGLLSVFVNPVFVFGIILLPAAIVILLTRPMVALSLFVVLSFLRPADTIPALGALPLAKIVGGLTLLAVIFRYIFTREIVSGSRQMVLLLIFAATLFVSIPFSFWPSKSIEVSLDFLKIIVFYFAFVNIVRDYSRLRLVSLITLVCITILSISTSVAFFSGDVRGASAIGAGLFGDANDVALILVSGVPLAGFWTLGRRGGPVSFLLHWGTMAVLATGVIATGSRGGLLGLVAVLFVYLLRGRNKVAGVVVLVLAALLFVALVPSNVNERYMTIGEYQQDDSAMGRIYAWKAGLHMMATRPLTGVGAGCFEIAFGTHYRPAGFNSARWISPHNTLVQIGGETGVIGLSVFLYLYFLCLIQLKKLKIGAAKNHLIERMSTIFMSSLIGFGICAFFLTQAFNFMFYFLAAAAVSLYNINAASGQEPQESIGSKIV